MPKKSLQRAAPRVSDDLVETAITLDDDAEVCDAVVSGDHRGLELTLMQFASCRLVGVQLTGTRLIRSRLTDCVVADSDLSGVFLEECHLARVEFRHCRLSGLQALGSTFDDVAFVDCKLAEASLRRTVWARAEFHDCDLVDSDFQESRLPASRFARCDLSGADLSKSYLRGSRLHGSVLDRIRGGDALRGVRIGEDQIIPTALAVFAALNISIEGDVSEGE